MVVKLVKNGAPALFAAVDRLVKQVVMVGIPAQAAARKEGAINNATLGYIQEHGSPAANIPARPFLVPGVRAARREVARRYKLGAKAALAGDKAGVERSLAGAGKAAAFSVKARMTAGIAPDLSPATLRARRARGRTGETPLIDTGGLRNAITYVLRGRKL